MNSPTPISENQLLAIPLVADRPSILHPKKRKTQAYSQTLLSEYEPSSLAEIPF